MIIRHLTAADFRTSTWSGGTTTELFLYPQGGSYATRDFLFRISSATVDLEESDFTVLPGVERYITPLQGAFTLTHPGHSAVFLAPLAAPYRFRGDIVTHCVGKATDFNLMLKGCEGRMELQYSDAPIEIGFNGFYPTKNGIFTLDGQQFHVEKGDLLVIFADAPAKLSLGDVPTLTCWAKI